jgi:hypothetical protein
MRFYFHELAQAELDRAVECYEGCRRGLGMEPTQEVHAAIACIIKYPDAWSSLSKNTRRCLVNRFPFGVVYRIKSDSLHIIAIADLRRTPEFWQNRG